MAMYNVTSAITLIMAVNFMRQIIADTNPSQGLYWEPKFIDVLNKKITDGHDTSNPLAYFLVPLLGKAGRKMTAGQRKRNPEENPHSFVLKQFAYVVSHGIQSKADRVLRSLEDVTPSAIADGLFGSHGRSDNGGYGSVAGRELGNQLVELNAPKMEVAVGAVNLVDLERNDKLDNSSRMDRMSRVDKLLEKYNIKELATTPLELPADVPTTIPVTQPRRRGNVTAK